MKWVKNDTMIRFEVEVPKDAKIVGEKPPADEKKDEKKAAETKKEVTTEEQKKEDVKKEDVKKDEAKKDDEKEEPKTTKTLYFEYDLAAGKVALLPDFKADPKKPGWAQVSPDGKTVLFARGHNLFMMDADNYKLAQKDFGDPKVQEVQLTTDGEDHYSFARSLLDEAKTTLKKDQKGDTKHKDGPRVPAIGAVWAKDSSRFAMVRADERKVGDLWVINSLAQPRPTLESYRYAMPGEENVDQQELLVFDRASKQRVTAKADAFKDQSLQIATGVTTARERAMEKTEPKWLGDSADTLYLYRSSRDLHRVDVCSVNAVTGAVKPIIEERLNTYIDTQPLWTVNNGQEFIHRSERDGWGHYYLFDATGLKAADLEQTDVSALVDAGFKFPEPFKVKADDGVTDLYGVMYKPFDFDPGKKYPIIAYVYPGPQTEAVTKTFSPRSANVALANIGFIVVEVGNRGGNPQRSKWYHNFGYGNLRDYGLADKKAAIEQLARKNPWIDLHNVGIWGHSGGGFMSTAAMLVYPDFFKVAVSESGNHENNIYNRWWSEKHHGVKEATDKDGKVKFEYTIDRNSDIAKNLKGHLLLSTGDIDNNVHPANTLRLADALIKANKRFDMFILPGQRHGYGPMADYFFWVRADYFAEHLLGVRPDSVDLIELARETPQVGAKKTGTGGTK